jgi:hypothetical protein
MRHSLQKSGLLVVFALLTQILAPIGGIWAATARASDPLAGAPICAGLTSHQDVRQDTGQEDGTRTAVSGHSTCCPLCAVTPPVPLPDNSATGRVLRTSGQIAWVQSGERRVVARERASAQARAPPSLV